MQFQRRRPKKQVVWIGIVILSIVCSCSFMFIEADNTAYVCTDTLMPEEANLLKRPHVLAQIEAKFKHQKQKDIQTDRYKCLESLGDLCKADQQKSHQYYVRALKVITDANFPKASAHIVRLNGKLRL